MGRSPWVVYLWPGLPQVWRSGHFAALGVAFGFAVVLNFLLLGTVVWSELLDPRLRTLGWSVAAVVWGVWAVLSIRIDSRHSGFPQEIRRDGQFALVIEQYLKRNWFEAEHLLQTIIRENPSDADARLMLASLLRRTGRTEEAAAQLLVVESLPGAAKWSCELRRERALLQADRAEAAEAQPPPQEGNAARAVAPENISRVSEAA